MFSGENSKDIEAFALALAREFERRYPKGKSGTAAEVARAIDDICNRAAAFQRERKLGIYGRAKLGTSFKLELKEIGYPSEFIDSLTSQLLLSMSGK